MLPGSTGDLVTVVKWANKWEIPLWPICEGVEVWRKVKETKANHEFTFTAIGRNLGGCSASMPFSVWQTNHRSRRLRWLRSARVRFRSGRLRKTHEPGPRSLRRGCHRAPG